MNGAPLVNQDTRRVAEARCRFAAGMTLMSAGVPMFLFGEEVGAEKVPGQADSAPHKFDLKRHLLKAALLALVLFAIYYVNWTYGWITADDLDFYS